MLESLHRRPRGWALARVLSRVSGGGVQAGPGFRELRTRAVELDGMRQALEARESEQRERQIDAGLILEHEIPAYPHADGPATRRLLARLDPEDVAEAERRLDGPFAAYSGYGEGTRGHIVLVAGVHHRIPGVIEKSGLTPDEPPQDVHAMARGPLAAGGDPFLADFIAGGLERSGAPLGGLRRVLDFGCSSGRILRVLSAAWPDVGWSGCDPNEAAIDWAAVHLPGATFFVSPQEPPLALEDGSLDAAYAISIWSHFDSGAALRWLAEMRRVLRPGGRLLMTTHGVRSLVVHVECGALGREDAHRCSTELQRCGFSFLDVFGEAGDDGVSSPEWGNAYFTPEWLMARILPSWAVVLYEPGRLDSNQDLYVLEKRG